MAVDTVKNESGAEEYRTPKKVVKIGLSAYECPNCGLIVSCMRYPTSYCPYCGQAIDWSEAEE